jgi:hypothetical protein
MKNKRFLAGIPGLVLVFGLIICGCPTDSDGGGGGNVAKFEGVWRNPYGSHATYIFTGYDVSFTNDSNVSWSGTFTFNDTTITFNNPNGTPASWTQTYTLSETSLTLTNIEGQPGSSYGTFEKQ